MPGTDSRISAGRRIGRPESSTPPTTPALAEKDAPRESLAFAVTTIVSTSAARAVADAAAKAMASKDGARRRRLVVRFDLIFDP